MSHLKKNWKKYLAGLAGLCLVLLLAGVIISHRVYLPGVNFWWRFCSMNDEMTVYWYDEETGEFTGESAKVEVKLTGFDKNDTVFDNNQNYLNGEIHIEGFNLGAEGIAGEVCQMVYTHNLFGRYRMISGVTMGITSDGFEAKPYHGDSCILEFLMEDPALVRIFISTVLEDGTRIGYSGYCGDSLEEAKTNRERMSRLESE